MGTAAGEDAADQAHVAVVASPADGYVFSGCQAVVGGIDVDPAMAGAEEETQACDASRWMFIRLPGRRKP